MNYAWPFHANNVTRVYKPHRRRDIARAYTYLCICIVWLKYPQKENRILHYKLDIRFGYWSARRRHRIKGMQPAATHSQTHLSEMKKTNIKDFHFTANTRSDAHICIHMYSQSGGEIKWKSECESIVKFEWFRKKNCVGNIIIVASRTISNIVHQ